MRSGTRIRMGFSPECGRPQPKQIVQKNLHVGSGVALWPGLLSCALITATIMEGTFLAMEAGIPL